jgi:DNA-binding NtrC family response regulator
MEAENGLEGLEAVRRSGKDIQLILTDVVMPRMNGPDMAEHVALTHPEIKVLFMSGYEDGILHRHESLAAARIVQKPFSMQALAGAVREALDRPPATSAPDRRLAR